MCSPTYASYLELDQERKWETFHRQRKKQHQREQILYLIFIHMRLCSNVWKLILKMAFIHGFLLSKLDGKNCVGKGVLPTAANGNVVFTVVL